MSRLLKRLAVCLVPAAVLAFGAREWIRNPPADSVPAAAETVPVASEGDAADDVAIWVCPDDPARTLIVGVDKKSGLHWYDLEGRELGSFADGELNNVDLRDGFTFADGRVAPIVVATDNALDALRAYRIDPKARSVERLERGVLPVTLDAEGICLYRRPADGRLYACVVGEEPRSDEYEMHQFEIVATAGSAVELRPAVRRRIGSKSEGCFADDATGWLYVSEENVGVWRYPADPGDARERSLICEVGLFAEARHDVEGIALHESGNGRFLVVSSQGSDDFVVFQLDRDPPVYRGRFAVDASGAIDGASETDGIEIVSSPIPPRYPEGLLIVHDGENEDHGARARQNYKLVSWANVREALGL